MKNNQILLLMFLLFTFTVFSQDIKKDKNQGNFRYITVKSHYGSYFYSGEGLANTGILDNGYGGIDVKLGWQPSSEDHWASMYGYPSYGFGAYVGFLGNSQIFGNPNALFGFINFPISNSTKKNIFSIEPAVGLTYNLNPFNPENNPLNDAIGSKVAVYFSLDFGWNYAISREMDFAYGLDFTHFSNGRTFVPNYGLNMIGINLGLKYNYNRNQRKLNDGIYGTNVLQARFNRPSAKPKVKLNESVISIYLAGGTVQKEGDEGTDNRHGTFSGVIEYQYLLNSMSGFTAGVNVFYDNSLFEKYPNPSDRYLIGAHIGYDLMFWKLALKFQAGTYFNGSKGKSPLFLRPALQYNISKRFFVQVGLKTNGGADWVEYGIGFKPFKW